MTSVEETKTVVCDYTMLCMFIHLENLVVEPVVEIVVETIAESIEITEVSP